MTGKAKKIISVLTGIVIAIFLVIALIALVVTVVYRTRGEDAEILGYQFRIVVSGSMEPAIPQDSLVVIDTVGSGDSFYDDLAVGDVITFYWFNTANVDDVIVTHRIIAIDPPATEGGNYTFTLQGDAVDGDTQVITQDEIIGRVVWSSYPLGCVLTFLRSSAGIGVCLILPAALIMIYEVYRIIRLVREGKAEQKREKEAARDEELESLRRELAELKKEKEKKDA